MASLLERDEGDDAGVVLHNLPFFYDNFESISQVLDGDSSTQHEFLAIESEVYTVFFLINQVIKSSCQ